MENILQITAICMIGSLLALVLKRSNMEFGLFITMAVIIAVFYVTVEPIKEILAFMEELATYSGVNQTLYIPLYKAVAISFVVKIGSSLCRDAGESALSAAIEMAGAVCTLLISLPLMKTVFFDVAGVDKLKRLICFLAMIIVLTTSVSAANDVPGALMDALPYQARELLENTEFSGVSDLTSGLRDIWSNLWGSAKEVLYRQGKGAVSIFLVVMLCSLFKGVQQGRQEMNELPLVMVGTLSIAILTMGDMSSFVGLGAETIRVLQEFSKVLIPVLATTVAGTGAFTTATFQQVTVVVLVELLLSVIYDLLLPLIYLYIVVLTAAACLSSGELAGIAEGMKKIIVWVLTTMLIAFTLYLSAVRIIAGNVDGAAVKMTKTAISGVVPVVGGIIAEAAETILAGAGVLKNTIGIFGTLAILSVCAYPFLQLGVQYLLYKIAAYCSLMVGQVQLCKLIQGLGGAFGLVLGMAGSSALLLLISVFSCIAAVMPW